MSSEDYVAPEQLLSESLRKKAREMFENEESATQDEYDVGKLFERILWESDWTDKLATVLSSIRNRFLIGETNTKLSPDLQTLVPNMDEVKRAYEEMTSGYKDFIREVLRAKNRPRDVE